jgi:glutathione S-transferase/RNA polymerase-associated protein
MIEEICDTYYEAINWGLAEIRVFGRARGELAEQMTARAATQTAGIQRWLERELGGRPFFNGDAFGWGDLSVYPYAAASQMWGFPAPAGSNLVAWLERVGTRESAKKCADAVATVMASFQNLGPLVESGVFVREYRDHRLEWMIRSGGIQVITDGLDKRNIRFHVELE